MLMPKRTKHRKMFKGRNRGMARRGATIAFGDYGLQAVGAGDRDQVRRLVTHTLVLAVLVLLAFCTLGRLYAREILITAGALSMNSFLNYCAKSTGRIIIMFWNRIVNDMQVQQTTTGQSRSTPVMP